MVLDYLNRPVDPEQLVDMVYSPSRKGSLQPFMVAGVRRLGWVGYEIGGHEALFREIAADNPVIVLQNLGLKWFPRWHYAVVTGYDLNEEWVRMHSGTLANLQTDLIPFMQTWKRGRYWGMVVTSPARIPQSAGPAQYFQSLLLLEKNGFKAQASQGYCALLERWPDQLAPALALANSYYAQGDLPATIDLLRRTVAEHPQSDAALNNLAYVLYETGNLIEAEEMARRAVSLAGEFAEPAKETLDAILLRAFQSAEDSQKQAKEVSEPKNQDAAQDRRGQGHQEEKQP
jgi:tetratricopeptide (TPR) repeat protein